MRKIVSQWHGPYSIIRVQETSWLVGDPKALRPGVYLWTAHVGDEYLVNYIGMSTNSVTTRTLEHLSRTFGTNVVESPASFRQGSRAAPLFHPMHHNWNKVRDAILPRLIEYLEEIRIFFAPIDDGDLQPDSKVVLERIESALIQQVWAYQAKHPSLEFLTNNRRSREVDVDDRDIEVEIAVPDSQSPIRGIENSFIA